MDARGSCALAKLVDHCVAALAIAEARGDRFLAYLLSMTVQAARQQMPPG